MIIIYIVTINYSFNEDTVAVLFDNIEDATEFIKTSALKEHEADLELQNSGFVSDCTVDHSYNWDYAKVVRVSYCRMEESFATWTLAEVFDLRTGVRKGI